MKTEIRANFIDKFQCSIHCGIQANHYMVRYDPGYHRNPLNVRRGSSNMKTLLIRIFLILVAILGPYYVGRIVDKLSRRILNSRSVSQAKIKTITSFITSVAVFVLYFVAFGFVLSELGISLTTYFASASVIGLAVSFGLQGVVQDVIMGLTVVIGSRALLSYNRAFMK